MANHQVWNANPGKIITKSKLHQQYGVAPRVGICKSEISQCIFLFSDILTGRKCGLISHWYDDGCMHFPGQGRIGNQRMESPGNNAVLTHRHREPNWPLRVFRATRATGRVQWEYIGEFEIDAEDPFYETMSHDLSPNTFQIVPSQNILHKSQNRKVIIFRLRPINISLEIYREIQNTNHIRFRHVAYNYNNQTANFNIRPQPDPDRTAQLQLVKAFIEFACKTLNYQIYRKVIHVPNKRQIFVADAYVADKNLLVQASGVTRVQIIKAIEKLKYAMRFIPDSDKPFLRCGVLLPEQPEHNLGIRTLLRGNGFKLIYFTPETPQDGQRIVGL